MRTAQSRSVSPRPPSAAALASSVTSSNIAGPAAEASPPPERPGPRPGPNPAPDPDDDPGTGTGAGTAHPVALSRAMASRWIRESTLPGSPSGWTTVPISSLTALLTLAQEVLFDG